MEEQLKLKLNPDTGVKTLPIKEGDCKHSLNYTGVPIKRTRNMTGFCNGISTEFNLTCCSKAERVDRRYTPVFPLELF